MTPEQVPAELVETAARVIDPDAFEVPLRGYSEGAAAQSRDDARGSAAEILAAVYLNIQALTLDEAADFLATQNQDIRANTVEFLRLTAAGARTAATEESK